MYPRTRPGRFTEGQPSGTSACWLHIELLLSYEGEHVFPLRTTGQRGSRFPPNIMGQSLGGKKTKRKMKKSRPALLCTANQALMFSCSLPRVRLGVSAAAWPPLFPAYTRPCLGYLARLDSSFLRSLSLSPLISLFSPPESRTPPLHATVGQAWNRHTDGARSRPG